MSLSFWQQVSRKAREDEVSRRFYFLSNERQIMKTYLDDIEMNAHFTHEFVRTAFAVIDQMADGAEVWDGWCFDISGEDLVEQLLDLLETYY
jgi:hypothetical protein